MRPCEGHVEILGMRDQEELSESDHLIEDDLQSRST